MNVVQYLIVVGNTDTGESREVVVMRDAETVTTEQARAWVAGMLAEPWSVRLVIPVVAAEIVTA